MGHTNSTANYNLPQFIGTDKPTWLGDINNAFSAIDTAIANAAATATTADGKADALGTTVSGHTTQIGTLSNTVTAQGNTLNTVTALIGNGTPTTTDQTIIGAINEINAKVEEDEVEISLSIGPKIKAMKFGKVVTFQYISTATSATASADDVIGTIPASFRPKYNGYMLVTLGNDGSLANRFSFKTNGDIAVTSAVNSGVVYVGTMTTQI